MTRNKQQGIALVVSLVMLMVLTIMGVSSMRNTSLQLQVAKNTQERHVAFQTSLSGVEHAVRNADTTQIDTPQVFNYSIPNNPELTASGTTSYGGCTRALGASLESGGSLNIFETVSTGVSAGGASVTIVTGLGKHTPANCAAER